MIATRLEKPAARAEALALRDKISTEVAAKIAGRLADHGPRLAREHGAKVVAAYWSIGAEILTLPLLEALDAAGFAVALPITGKRGQPLVFRQWKRGDRLVAGKMNIPEPEATAPVLDPDLLFVPLAAFDRAGQRIGYGAGFYDVTLKSLRARKPIVAVGVGYAAQEIESVPHEAHDEKLDVILTERELIVIPIDA
ncbi:MAG: 5-formyltetrahydrofolate cyclo-ligase [Beijerinckiaceae bacterium]|nr:5-formyltetrahydrofolate cyclo-ligase [Beijerinckiaceae bacterium]